MSPGQLGAWLRKPEARCFVRLLFVGGVNTLVGYLIFAALILVGLPTPAAVVVGTILAVLFNFFSTGTVVFQNANGRLLPRFIGVYVAQMSLNVAAMAGLEKAGVHPLIGGALLLLPLAVFTYLAMRRFVFS